MAFGFGKKWWKRATGISSLQGKVSRKLGIRLSDGKLGAAPKVYPVHPVEPVHPVYPVNPVRPSGMKLYTFCPECDTKINYTPRTIGTIRKCDDCGQKIRLTEPPEPPPSFAPFLVMHAVLTFCTCGFWAPVGIIHYVIWTSQNRK